MAPTVEAARSLLFVPATRPDRFDRAAGSGADAVIVDLEDSVAGPDKPRAREAARDWLTAGSRAAVVRVNGAGTSWHDEDVAMAAAVGCGVLLPKADSVDVVERVRAALPERCALFALVETARGVRDAAQVCASAAVTRVAFGSVDFALDLGIDPVASSPVFDHARAVLAVASAAAGLPAPWDGVTTDLEDAGRLGADIAAARAVGFGGKLAVHPRQVAAINQAWTPTASELDWARGVLAAIEEPGVTGVVSVDGQMVDAPVVERARRLIARERP